jgi:soluble cytochrome b562
LATSHLDAKDILTLKITGCVNASARQAAALRNPYHNNTMKMKTLLTFVTAIAMGFTAIAAEDHTPLEKQMATINKSLRSLKRGLADASKKEENLALVQKINEAVVEACKLEPKKTKDQADKTAYLTKYKEQMDALGKTFHELEVAIKADKTDEAKEILEKLSKQKEKGHETFEVE